jgi:hypothetical protein
VHIASSSEMVAAPGSCCSSRFLHKPFCRPARQLVVLWLPENQEELRVIAGMIHDAYLDADQSEHGSGRGR